ncbi:MAG: MFS transporter [Phycisphaerales bacterium]
MSAWAHRAARMLGVEEGEARVVSLSALLFFLLMGGYFLVRPVRDALGIAGGADDLEPLILTSAGVMLLIAPIYAWGVHRLERRRFVALVLRVCAMGMVCFFALFAVVGLEHLWGGRAFYVFVSVYNLFVVSVFWSVMADCFRLEPSKRLFGLISVGGTLGGVCGALAMGLLSGVPIVFGAPVWAMLICAVTLELAVRCFRAIDAERPHDHVPDPVAPSVWTGLTAICRSRYLMGVCAYITLSSVVWTLLYIEQGRLIEAHVEHASGRIALFAGIDVASNALALAMQLFAAGFVMRRMGVGIALALLPAIGVVGFLALPLLPAHGAVFGFAPVIWGLIAFQVVRRSVQFGIAKPARATLFTVVGRDERYKAKALIDTYVYRSGDALGAGLSRWIGAAGSTGPALPYIAAGLAGVWLVTGLALGASQRRRAHRRDAAEPPPAPALAGA